MAIATTKQYSQKTVDAYTLASIVRGVSGDGWNWAAETGHTIVLTSNGVAPLTDYTRTGVNRYGIPAEIDNSQQEISCANDKGFTFTIDAMGEIERGGTIEVNRQLRKQIDEVITPAIDKYALRKLVSETPTEAVVSAVVTRANAYESFLQLNAILDDQLVPAVNRYAWVTPAFYNMLKLDESFTKASESTVRALTSGFLGDVDGVGLIKAPTSYLPIGTLAVIAHKDAWVLPVRLEEFKVHPNPQGISGTLVEGRVVYDAFVVERLTDGTAEKNGIAVLTVTTE